MRSEVYEKLKNIRDYNMRIASESLVYFNDYGEKMIMDDIKRAYDGMQKVDRINMMDFITITQIEAEMLGFYNYRSSGLFVLPLWMWWVIPAAGNFETINGRLEKYNFNAGVEAGRDSRGGFLGIGVRFYSDGKMNIGS